MENVDKLIEQANAILNEKLEQLEVLEAEKKEIKAEEAKDYSKKLVVFSLFVSIIVSSLFLCLAEIIPDFYNTTEQVHKIAVRLIQICALTMPFDAMAHSTYFTLRSGGKIYMTMLMDSGFICLVSLPLVFVLTK